MSADTVQAAVERARFAAFLERASEEVSRWPAWKQTLLGGVAVEPKRQDEVAAALLRESQAREAELVGLLRQAGEALSDLLDEQNGPPLWDRQKQWRAAEEKAWTTLRAIQEKVKQ